MFSLISWSYEIYICLPNSGNCSFCVPFDTSYLLLEMFINYKLEVMLEKLESHIEKWKKKTHNKNAFLFIRYCVEGHAHLFAIFVQIGQRMGLLDAPSFEIVFKMEGGGY